jgi:DNA gyrase/topoisomerase IV subunit A
MPCFICGKTNKTDNIQTETHHFYVEKAGENAVDWRKFGEFAKTCYNIQTGENIGHAFDWNEVAKNPDLFVDSKHNMIVLCKEHHISGSFGIHHVPFPDWILQKFAQDGFDFLLKTDNS